MLALEYLWLPILLSSLIVWIASALVWMVLPWHNKEWRPLPDEEAARGLLRQTPPGQYRVPYCDRTNMKSPDYQRKMKEGPLVSLTVIGGPPSMGRMMITWALYLLLTNGLIALVVASAVRAGASYMDIFTAAAIAGWLAYGWGAITEAIWFGRPWRAVLTVQLDAILYALLTAGVFGWLAR